MAQGTRDKGRGTTTCPGSCPRSIAHLCLPHPVFTLYSCAQHSTQDSGHSRRLVGASIPGTPSCRSHRRTPSQLHPTAADSAVKSHETRTTRFLRAGIKRRSESAGQPGTRPSKQALPGANNAVNPLHLSRTALYSVPRFFPSSQQQGRIEAGSQHKRSCGSVRATISCVCMSPSSLVTPALQVSSTLCSFIDNASVGQPNEHCKRCRSPSLSQHSASTMAHKGTTTTQACRAALPSPAAVRREQT